MISGRIVVFWEFPWVTWHMDVCYNVCVPQAMSSQRHSQVAPAGLAATSLSRMVFDQGMEVVCELEMTSRLR